MTLLIEDIDTDVLLIQPSTFFRKKNVAEYVAKYFDTISKAGGLIGDNPLEANYGLLKIATQLKKQNIKVSILDFNSIDFKLRQNGEILSTKHIQEILKKIDTKIIGISYMTNSFGTWESILYKIIRDIPFNKEMPIVYGGIHPSIYYNEILERRNDKNLYVLLGEGEIEFPNFCKHLLFSKNNSNGLKGIAGYAGEPQKQLISESDLISCLIADYSIVPKHAECNVRRYYLTRGCTSRCSFCSVSAFHSDYNRKYYRQPYSENKKCSFPQIKHIINDYQNGNQIVMGDLTFFETQWIFKDFCEQLFKEINISGVFPEWWCQSRADCINEESVKLMKKAGCTQIAIGCESANNNILKKMNKKIKSEEWIKALEIIKDYDLTTQGYFIIGAGFDSHFSVRQTISKIVFLIEKGLIDLVHLSVLAPFPGTNLYKKPEQCGIQIVDYDFSNYWMNCDIYGYGVPVYQTISDKGRVLLTSEDIYKYWKLAMKEISGALNKVKSIDKAKMAI